MASYVIVWENNTPGHQKVKNRSWPGHSAMNIGNIFDKGKVGDTINSYVSWWPGQSADFSVTGILKSLFTKSQKGDQNASILDDVRCETYLPDHVIRLNSSDEQEEKMRAEWRTVFLKPGGASYKNLRKNCSTIVSRVLHAAGYYAYKWAVDNNFAWSPADVRALADACGGTHMTWTAFMDILALNGITATDFQSHGFTISTARSGVYCSTGAPCRYQNDQTWQPDGKKGR